MQSQPGPAAVLDYRTKVDAAGTFCAAVTAGELVEIVTAHQNAVHYA